MREQIYCTIYAPTKEEAIKKLHEQLDLVIETMPAANGEFAAQLCVALQADQLKKIKP